jgi:UDP-glucose 4-epimerase
MERLYIITGWSGLIGSSLVKDLIANKNRVCLVEFNQRPNKRIFNEVEYINELEFHKINDISENSVLIHAACNANASCCSSDPVSAVESNINLTIKVLELCRKFNIKDFLFLSTGFLYGENNVKAHKESDPIVANNLYLSTKFTSEKIIQNYSQNYEIKSLIIRLGNVFGSQSSNQTVIGRILDQINNGEMKIKLHTLRPSRDFVYIKDVIDAIMIVSKNSFKKETNVLNVSSGTPTTIKELSSTICFLIDSNISVKEDQNNSIENNSHILLDIKKIKKLYNWKPTYNLHNALEEIINLNE